MVKVPAALALKRPGYGPVIQPETGPLPEDDTRRRIAVEAEDSVANRRSEGERVKLSASVTRHLVWRRPPASRSRRLPRSAR